MKKDKPDFYNIPLVEYLISIGEPIIQIGNSYYQHKDHDSLKINQKKNYFVWNSRRGEKNSTGGVVQYLQIVHGLSVREALTAIEQHLANKDISSFKQSKKTYPKTFKYRTNEADTPLTMQRYLVTKRKIPNKIVREFFKKGLIAENDNGEILFKWYKNNNVVGFSKQGTKKLTDEQKKEYGTTREYLKYVAPTTEEDTYWGFNYLVGKQKNLYFFESSIDLLSFYALYKTNLHAEGDFWLIETDGTAIEKVFAFLKYGLEQLNLKNHIKTLNICFDNDSAGLSAFEILSKNTFCGIDFTRLVSGNFKDWNEYLKNRSKDVLK